MPYQKVLVQNGDHLVDEFSLFDFNGSAWLGFDANNALTVIGPTAQTLDPNVPAVTKEMAMDILEWARANIGKDPVPGQRWVNLRESDLGDALPARCKVRKPNFTDTGVEINELSDLPGMEGYVVFDIRGREDDINGYLLTYNAAFPAPLYDTKSNTQTKTGSVYVLRVTRLLTPRIIVGEAA